MTAEQIISDLKERIATLTRERNDFLTQANIQAAAMGGGLQELETMLAYIVARPEADPALAEQDA